jgi:inositol transport system permease protein
LKPKVLPIATSSRRTDAIVWLRRYGTTLFLALLIIFFTSQNERFISLRNLTNILTEGSIYGIIAIGMTFVILTAGVDLSVGSLLAFAGMAGAYVAGLTGADFSASWMVALSTAICAGAAAGYLQGRAVTLLGIPPFIVTLGGMTIWRGATLILHDGAPISGFDQHYRWWGTGTIAHVPVPVALFALIAATGYVVQRYTRYGRHVYAVGGNPEAARLNGLNVAAIITSVAEATAGVGYELRVIASVVIGGASLSGGRGGIGGTIIGALLIGVLTNGLVIMHVSSYWQQVVIGLIIVAAVAFDTFAKSRR